MKFRFWHLSLLLAPAAFVLYWYNTNGATTGHLIFWLFGVSLLALLPLAQFNSDMVEVLARGRSQIVSGLMNAFLSNIPEIAIGFWLLMQVVRHPDLTTSNYAIVHGLLLGSVISNILLTLGLATFAGAWRHGRLRFSQERASGFASMLGLAVVGLALPTLATAFADHGKELLGSYTEEAVSLVVCAILFLSYIAYVLVEYFHVGDRLGVEKAEAAEAAHQQLTAAEEFALKRDAEAKAARAREMAQNGGELKPLSVGMTALALTALVVSIGAIAGVCATLVTVSDRVIVASPALTPLSFGLIVLPVICNFGELLEAVQMALGRRMEAAMDVAAGSSVQVPLFVTPAIVFVGFIFALLTPGLQQFTLVFKPLELVTVGLVVFVYALVNLDGETTWLEGVQFVVFDARVMMMSWALLGGYLRRVSPRSARSLARYVWYDRLWRRALGQRVDATQATESRMGSRRECGERAPAAGRALPRMSGSEGRAANKLMAERYRALARVGVGGTAVVFRCRDLHTQRIVAVKSLRSNAANATPEAAKRFHREARLAAQLAHPNIVRVLDYGLTLPVIVGPQAHWSEDPDKPTPYLAMEYVFGVTLKDLLRRVGPLPLDWVWRLGEQLCAALAMAHSVGVVHRDVKPQNVMLLDSPLELLAKLTDFGIARQMGGDLSALTATGQVIGTPDYLSPEQVLGEPGGPSSDLYSLGIVLYELVTGRLPFEADTPLAAASKRMMMDAPPLTAFRRDTPAALQEVILVALRRDMPERFRSAMEFAEALRWSRAHAPAQPAVARGSWLAPGRAEPRQPTADAAVEGELDLSQQPTVLRVMRDPYAESTADAQPAPGAGGYAGGYAGG